MSDGSSPGGSSVSLRGGPGVSWNPGFFSGASWRVDPDAAAGPSSGELFRTPPSVFAAAPVSCPFQAMTAEGCSATVSGL